MQPILRIRWAALLLATVLLPASATFHLMKIVELFPGTAAAPGAHYVVLQMYAGGQNLVGGHEVTIHDASGEVVAALAFANDVPNGANQATILVATPAAEAFFDVDADLVMAASLLKAGGKVCFAGTIDCVAWGSYAGSASGVGTPFNAPAGLLSGRAIHRRLNLAGSPSTLDGDDDTNDSANDFESGLPSPRNNAGMLGRVPGATCGNGAIEGLEQCDDGDTASGDGCSSTCLVDEVVAGPAAAVQLAGDFDGDGHADLLWRNSSSGENVIWRSADRSARQVLPTVAPTWIVAGVADYTGDGEADIVWRSTSSGNNVLWPSADRSARRTLASVAGQQWQVAGSGDFDGDGEADLLWRNDASGDNVVWRSAERTTRQALPRVVPPWTVAGVADYTGDGEADIAWRSTSSGGNVLWPSADRGARQALASVTSQQWQLAASGDFGGDGHADLLWRNAATGENVVWRSANRATRQALPTVASSWRVAGVGDYTGDGEADLVWRSTSSGANVLWPSAARAARQVLPTVGSQQWHIVP